MNIFERAARAKTRFVAPNVAGGLSVEQLFDLPIQATGSKLSLERIAHEVNSELQSFTAGISFLDTKPNPRKVELELQMELLKHVVESKQADAKAAETREKNKATKAQLLEIIAKKEGQSLEAKDVAELKKMYDEIGS